MGDVRQQQVEVLETGRDYVLKLVPAIKEIAEELRGQEKEDTKDYLMQIVDGINFVIEIVNVTLPLINEKDTILNQQAIEETVQRLSNAFMKGDNGMIAHELESGILPFLDIFYQVATVLLSK